MQCASSIGNGVRRGLVVSRACCWLPDMMSMANCPAKKPEQLKLGPPGVKWGNIVDGE